tara:strand:+ start:323 stop:493 length:171 start_codon:yes stop_codon:yes gene_type:complete
MYGDYVVLAWSHPIVNVLCGTSKIGTGGLDKNWGFWYYKKVRKLTFLKNSINEIFK